MRKVAVAVLPRCSWSRSSVVEQGATFLLSSRHLATGQIDSAFAATQDAVVVSSSETSMGASQFRKVLQKKNAPKPRKNKSVFSEPDSREAESSFVHTEVPQVKPKKGATAKKLENAYAKDSALFGATRRPTSSAKQATSSVLVVASKKATELTDVGFLKVQNVTACENVVVEKREELASCAMASADQSSLHEDLTEIMARFDLGTPKNADRWKIAAHKLLDHGISLASVTDILKRCRKLRCSSLWVDSTLKHLGSLGMSHKEMAKVILSWPTILNVTDSMFQLKIEFYESIGIDRDSLCKIIKNTVLAITKPLSVLRNNVAFWNYYMREVQENAARSMIWKNSRLLTYTSYEEKLAWLEAQKVEKKWLLNMSSLLSHALPRLMARAEWLDQLGIPGSKRAIVLVTVVHTQGCKLQARYENLLTVGFSRSQALNIISRVPSVLTCTEEYVNLKVNYVHHVMNVPLDTLASSSAVWAHNFERRIKSRHEVIKTLQSLGAYRKRDTNLESLIHMSNADFNRRFVEKLQDVLKLGNTLHV